MIINLIKIILQPILRGDVENLSSLFLTGMQSEFERKHCIISPRMTPYPEARVLLSIDYESWLTLTGENGHFSPAQRQELDGGFTCRAVDGILELLGKTRASFYLVGEILDWYPEVAQKIAAAGHELGFHCHTHRPLGNASELESDLNQSQSWLKAYGVRGYRAPRVRITEQAYPILKQYGFFYSSSLYAPAGSLARKSGIWELPVSTLRLTGGEPELTAPRHFSLSLLAQGEIPYGSSFIIGLLGDLVLRILEKELRAGRSPVIFLHPYELVRPQGWRARSRRIILKDPLQTPFCLNKSGFLRRLMRAFPVSPLGAWLDEALASNGEGQGD